MSAQRFALFDTTLGRCGIAWSAVGVTGVQLPEQRDSATRARLLRRYPGACEASPPTHIQQAIDGIAGLLRGEGRDLSAVALDMAGVAQFDQRVYAVARTIPAGATLTYGDIAVRLGDSSVAREVGQSLGQNPFPDHRALPPRVGGRRQGRRFLSGRRCDDQAAPARHRRRAGRRGSHAVREPSVACPAGTTLAERSLSLARTGRHGSDATADHDRARDELDG